MESRLLSVFVDESGVLKQSDVSSRFYIVTMVFHDQTTPVVAFAEDFDAEVRRYGIERMCFHAGPIIRQEQEFSIMSWELRNKIFSAMMGFSRRVDFRYHCFVVDKKFVNSADQIIRNIEVQFASFWERHPELKDYDGIKVYYDCGQSQITNLLHRIFSPGFLPPVEFAQGVLPNKYKLFQVADMICSLHLIEQKFLSGLPMTHSEHKFFGGPRNFKRVILRKIKAKELA